MRLHPFPQQRACPTSLQPAKQSSRTCRWQLLSVVLSGSRGYSAQIRAAMALLLVPKVALPALRNRNPAWWARGQLTLALLVAGMQGLGTHRGHEPGAPHVPARTRCHAVGHVRACSDAQARHHRAVRGVPAPAQGLNEAQRGQVACGRGSCGGLCQGAWQGEPPLRCTLHPSHAHTCARHHGRQCQDHHAQARLQVALVHPLQRLHGCRCGRKVCWGGGCG